MALPAGDYTWRLEGPSGWFCAEDAGEIVECPAPTWTGELRVAVDGSISGQGEEIYWRLFAPCEDLRYDLIRVEQVVSLSGTARTEESEVVIAFGDARFDATHYPAEEEFCPENVEVMPQVLDEMRPMFHESEEVGIVFPADEFPSGTSVTIDLGDIEYTMALFEA